MNRAGFVAFNEHVYEPVPAQRFVIWHPRFIHEHVLHSVSEVVKQPNDRLELYQVVRHGQLSIVIRFTGCPELIPDSSDAPFEIEANETTKNSAANCDDRNDNVGAICR